MNLFEVSLLLAGAPAETTPLSFLTALLFDERSSEARSSG